MMNIQYQIQSLSQQKPYKQSNKVKSSAKLFTQDPEKYASTLPKNYGNILLFLLHCYYGRGSLRMPKAIIAKTIGCSTKTVQRALRFFEDQGIVILSQYDIYRPYDFEFHLSPGVLEKSKFGVIRNPWSIPKSVHPIKEEDIELLKSSDIYIYKSGYLDLDLDISRTRTHARETPRLENTQIKISPDKKEGLRIPMDIVGASFTRYSSQDNGFVQSKQLNPEKRGLKISLLSGQGSLPTVPDRITKLSTVEGRERFNRIWKGLIMLSREVKDYYTKNPITPESKQKLLDLNLQGQLYGPLINQIAELLQMDEPQKTKLLAFPDEILEFGLNKIHEVKFSSRSAQIIEDGPRYFLKIMMDESKRQKVKLDWCWSFTVCEIMGIPKSYDNSPRRPFVVDRVGKTNSREIASNKPRAETNFYKKHTIQDEIDRIKKEHLFTDTMIFERTAEQLAEAEISHNYSGKQLIKQNVQSLMEIRYREKLRLASLEEMVAKDPSCANLDIDAAKLGAAPKMDFLATIGKG